MTHFLEDILREPDMVLNLPPIPPESQYIVENEGGLLRAEDTLENVR